MQQLTGTPPATHAPDVELIGQQPSSNGASAPTHPPAPARARGPRPRPLQPHTHEGVQTRNAFDRREADDYAELTAQLSAGVTVRILRTRPSWAAGWIEDLELDSGDVSELFEHLRAEHGGQVYSVQLIGRDNRILYKARVPIAGPVRRDGRPINREQWEGTEAARVEPRERERNAPAANIGNGFQPMELIRLVLDMQKESSGQITEAIREMQRMQTKQTEGLIAAVMDQRSSERTTTSLAGQLQEVAKVAQQVDEIRANIIASAPQSQQRDDQEPPDPIRAMTADILKSAIQNEMGKRSGPQQPAAAAPRVVRVRPQQAPTQAPANGQASRRPPSVEPLQQTKANGLQ